MAAGGSEELVARGSEELAAGCSEEMAAGSDVCGWRLEQTASQRFKLVSFQDQISQFEHSHQIWTDIITNAFLFHYI